MHNPHNVIELYPQQLSADFDTFFAMLGFGVNPSGMRRMYYRAALRMNTLSDGDLAALGLTRAEIPAFVMRHKFPNHAPLRLRQANS
ncbi:MAG: hypothetical protein ACPGNV_00505 [Mangrovicoccus sp.]